MQKIKKVENKGRVNRVVIFSINSLFSVNQISTR